MKLVLVGAGGYAELYVDWFLKNKDPEIQLEGIVARSIARSSRCKEIQAAGIPIYGTLDAFYEEHEADLAVIVTPTYVHLEQCLCAVRHGSNVLCEKPAAPTTEEVETMIRAEQITGKFIAIAFQMSYCNAIQKLKQDILDGVLGKPLSLKSIVLWPRTRSYYTRSSGWGGKIFRDGKLLLDSIAANACGHYIHNMFFLLGENMNSTISPERVEAECLRANDIENFDTCVLRMTTQQGVRIYFAGTHAVNKTQNPVFEFQFEKGTVTCEMDGDSLLKAQFADGTVKVYGDPQGDDLSKLKACIEAVKTGEKPICTCQTAYNQVALVEALYENVKITDFPRDMVHLDGDQLYVDGLFETLCKAFESEAMLSEMGCSYAEKYEF